MGDSMLIDWEQLRVALSDTLQAVMRTINNALARLVDRLEAVGLLFNENELMRFAIDRLGLTEVDVRRLPCPLLGEPDFILWNRRRIPLDVPAFLAWRTGGSRG